MHIKGVCQEVDWLFPIWKRVMIGREKKANRLLLFYGWTSLGVSFWSLSYPVLLQPESQTYPGQGADPPAGWGMTVFLRWNLWSGRGRSTSWGPLTGVEYPQGLQHDHYWVGFSSVQFSSVAQSCPTLCDPMNRSTPGLPVHHKLLELTQTRVHQIGNAIQPYHSLSSPSPPVPNPSQHQGLFQWVNSLHEVAKVLEFQLQHQSFQWTTRTDLL